MKQAYHRHLPIILPMISTMLLMLGAGFLNTVIVINLYTMGVEEWVIGVASSAYYVGMVLGTLGVVAHYILSVTHVRAYATFTAMLAIAVLAHTLTEIPFIWILLRVVIGFAIGAFYVIIESWMLSTSEKHNSGKVLAMYMVALYGSQSVAQLFIQLTGADLTKAFTYSAVLICLSILPMTSTSIPSPSFDKPASISYKKLFKLSPTGVSGCFFSGLLIAGLISMMPLYLEIETFSRQDIGYVMFAIIFGGMAFQLPLGHLSDRMDRRIMLVALCAVASILFLMLIFKPLSLLFLLVCLFFAGGAVYALYPISINHVGDLAEHNQFISVVQGLMLIYSVGAIAGPVVASYCITLFSSVGLFYFLFVTCFGQAVFYAYRTVFERRRKDIDTIQFVASPMTSPVVAELGAEAVHEQEVLKRHLIKKLRDALNRKKKNPKKPNV